MAKSETEKYAVLIEGKHKRTVKAWQYYSIFEFCRWQGESKESSDAIAKWCRSSAVAGDVLDKGQYSICIEERTN